jgi:hypothetical protein
MPRNGSFSHRPRWFPSREPVARASALTLTAYAVGQVAAALRTAAIIS